MISIKQCDAFLAKHHQYISPLVLAIAFIVALDLVTPTLLLAQTEPSTYIPPAVQQSNTIFCDVLGRQATMEECGLASSQQPGSNTIFCDSLRRQTTKDECDANNSNQQPQSGQPNYQFQPNQQQQMMPQQGGSNFNNSQPQPGQGQNGNFNQGPQMGGQGQQGQQGQMGKGNNGPSEKQQAQQLKQMKQGMTGMEQNIKSLQKQILSLTKKGLVAPSDITESITKITAIIQGVKSATTFDEAQNAGIDEMQDLMQSLQDQRMSLERLARWPQTLKQADQSLKTLVKSVTQNKTLATKLAKSGYDISDLVGKFEASIQALKDSRNRAVELIKTDSEAAFDEIQDNFFDQMDDVTQSDRTIKELGSLSKFASSFKSQVATAKRTIKSLTAKKLDISELQSIFDSVVTKGAEINALLKVKPIDTDAMVGMFEELDNLRQEFENARLDLVGDSGTMPWETGPQQFNMKSLNTNSINQFIPQKPEPFDPGFNGSQSGNSGMNQMAPGTF